MQESFADACPLCAEVIFSQDPYIIRYIKKQDSCRNRNNRVCGITKDRPASFFRGWDGLFSTQNPPLDRSIGGGKILLIFDKFFLFFTNILSIFIVTNDKNGRSACKRFQKSRNYITPAQETPRRTLRFRPAGTLHGSTGNTPKQKQRTKSTTIKKRDHSLSI